MLIKYFITIFIKEREREREGAPQPHKVLCGCFALIFSLHSEPLGALSELSPAQFNKLDR